MPTYPSLRSLISGAWLLAFAVLMAAVFCPRAALAQNSAVTGTVVDSTGGMIPKASVKLHNLKTGVDQSAETTSAGVYRPVTVPGIYDVTVAKAGFRTLRFAGITLTVEQTLSLNATLEVGGQTVAPIELDSGQISNIVNQTSIVNLPLILRDPYSLVLLSPGVVQSNSSLGGFSPMGRERETTTSCSMASTTTTATCRESRAA